MYVSGLDVRLSGLADVTPSCVDASPLSRPRAIDERVVSANEERRPRAESDGSGGEYVDIGDVGVDVGGVGREAGRG